jgi:hypothetical protein
VRVRSKHNSAKRAAVYKNCISRMYTVQCGLGSRLIGVDETITNSESNFDVKLLGSKNS